jgi:WD40 repeat protein
MIRLWNIQSEYPDEGSIELKGHDKGVQAVAWSDDGRFLVSAGNDASVRVWSIGDEGLVGEPLILLGHDGLVRAVALPAELEFVASASYDNSARIWPLRTAPLVQLGCAAVGRDLDEAEYAQYVGGKPTEVCPGP